MDEKEAIGASESVSGTSVPVPSGSASPAAADHVPDDAQPTPDGASPGSWSYPPWMRIALLAGGVAVLLLSLRLRLPSLGGRPLGFDEAFHSRETLAAPSLSELRRAVAVQYQPLLDHLLRRYLWAPLLGTQELGIRLPALLASLCATIATMVVAAWAMRRNRRSLLEVILAALAVGVWHAGYGQDIGASGFARHYSLTECLSILWAGLFLFGEPERRWLRLAVVGFLFANTHFFSLAFIGTGAAFLIIEHLTQGRRREALREAIVLLGIVGATALVNAPALAALLGHPIEARGLAESGTFVTALAETPGLVERFLRLMEMPLLPGVAWLLFVLAAGALRALPRALVGRLAGLACLAVPGLLFVGRLRSAYPLLDRYFMPFLGLAPAVLAVGAVVTSRLADNLKARVRATSPLARVPLAALPLAAFLLVDAIRLLALPGSIAAPVFPSRRAMLMEELKRSERPVFLLASPCWTDEVVKLYWQTIGRPAPAARLEVAHQQGYPACVAGGFPPDSRPYAELADFLRREPAGIIALYQHHLPCFRPRFASPGQVTMDGTGGSCLLLLQGITSMAEAQAAAVARGFPATLTELLQQPQHQYAAWYR